MKFVTLFNNFLPIFFINIFISISSSAIGLEELEGSNDAIVFGLFPGTFDPPTVAHFELARLLLKHGVHYFVPVTNTLTDHKPDASSFISRSEMVRISFHYEKQIAVPPTSIFNIKNHSMLTTIEFIKHRFPNAIFVSVIGSDVADQMTGRAEGYRYERDSVWWSKVKSWLVVSRSDSRFIFTKIFNQPAKTINQDKSNKGISSSQVRSLIRAEHKEWRSLVPDKVAEFIENQNLYQNSKRNLVCPEILDSTIQ